MGRKKKGQLKGIAGQHFARIVVPKVKDNKNNEELDVQKCWKKTEDWRPNL